MSASLEFPHRLAGHCASGAFRDLFEFRGYRHDGEPLSEAMVFGLGAGLDVGFLPRPTPRVPFYLAGRSPMFEESLLRRLGGSLIRYSEPDVELAWEAVRARLDRGEPVAVVGDCQKLEYLNTRTSMPLHVFVVTGYDETHVTVADNDRAALQRCSHASFRAARAALGFPFPAMNVRFEIAWPERLPPPATLVGPALAETVAWLRNPHGPPVYILGEHAFGLPAVAALESAATAWAETRPSDPGLHAALLWIAIEKAGTGGGLFRRLWRDFLREAHALRPGTALKTALGHYSTLADEWTDLGTRTPSSAGFTTAAQRLVRLAQAEREGVALLHSAAEESQRDS